MAIENPFQDPLRFDRQAPECAIVIFGANGDLTRRKLMPALYRLAYDRRLSAGFAVIGISRTPLSDDQFRDKMRESVQQFSEDTAVDADVWAAFARGLYVGAVLFFTLEHRRPAPPRSRSASPAPKNATAVKWKGPAMRLRGND